MSNPVLILSSSQPYFEVECGLDIDLKKSLILKFRLVQTRLLLISLSWSYELHVDIRPKSINLRL